MRRAILMEMKCRIVKRPRTPLSFPWKRESRLSSDNTGFPLSGLSKKVTSSARRGYSIRQMWTSAGHKALVHDLSLRRLIALNNDNIYC